MEFELGKDLVQNVKSIIDETVPLVSNLANISRLLYETIDNVLWSGFYLMEKGKLVLGPYQGPIACTSIRVGKGVCGKTVELKETLIVPNVDEFPGHIACSSLSKSEIVVPIIKNDEVLGVIDIDSELLNNFNDKHQKILEEVADIIASII